MTSGFAIGELGDRRALPRAESGRRAIDKRHFGSSDVQLFALPLMRHHQREKLPSMEPTEFSLLRQAVWRGDAEEVLSLLQDGADPNDLSDVATGGWSVLDSAIEESAPEIVEVLLQHGANPNFSSNGQTVLYHSVELACAFASEEPDGALDPEDVRVIRLLLDYGADPSVPNREGRTPVDAARGRRMKTLEPLANELEQRTK